jgi:hypothetical protein
MKKLRLDDLTVETFATSDEPAPSQGTVVGYHLLRTAFACPESWNGTCWVTCLETCEETCDCG